ncbi:membrane protein [Leptolyngbya sp. Heron Island J]|nr:membrane protein [Leptolyngbya sp. Heron Island J]
MESTWVTGFLGGLLIGLSATLLLAFNGRIAGISGIVNGAIQGDEIWRWLFIAGMLLGGLVYEHGLAAEVTPRPILAPGSMILGGFLVGFGTRLGNGCTSGHGVCGLGRLSLRSLVAVLTFLTTAMVTVWITRHGIAG